MTRFLRNPLLALPAMLIFLLPSPAQAVTLEQVVSRENNGFDAATARLVVGRDGRVYLGHANDPGYLLNMRPDGSDRLGFPLGHATDLTAVSADGTYALRQAHFAHTAGIYTRDGKLVNSFTDLNNDNYDAPQDIAVGASGDFYLLDGRTTNRVIRLNGKTGKAINIYSLPKPGNVYYSLLVNEATNRFYLGDWAQSLRIVGFDGKLVTAAGLPNVFTVAEDGTYWGISARNSDTLTHYSADGKPIGTSKMDLGDRKPNSDEIYFSWIGLLPGGEVALKRTHPYELYARYDLATGAYRGSVEAKHEKLTVSYPSPVWTAGQAVPLTIDFNAGGRTTKPAWRVWITPFGVSDWRELPYAGGQLTVPAAFGGLYQLKISPEVSLWQGGVASEYLVHEVVEVRQPNSVGTLNVFTPGNRVHYGRGEAIDLTVTTRSAGTTAPAGVRLNLWDLSRPDPAKVASQVLDLTGKETKITLPARLTDQLRPANYRLEAVAAGWTPVAQEIEIGPGQQDASPFRIMTYGDYSATLPTGDVWTAADMTRRHLKWATDNAVNMFVDRTTPGHFGLGWSNSPGYGPYLTNLKERLSKDPSGVAPEKGDLLYPNGETVAAYGAAGMSHMLILMGMDAGLPMGTGYDPRTPAQFAAVINDNSKALKELPAWRGFDWAANWWAGDQQYKDDAEKAAFQAAWKKALDTGAWDPVLGTVADRVIGWQLEAQQVFGDTLRKNVTGRHTVSPGPYRRPNVYSPESFATVDEVDLQYQAEQITTPYWTATAADFYRRPGKPTWLHPEIFNDTGTGEELLPMNWLALMRGADTTGVSGLFPFWGQQPLDWRHGYHGLASVFRNLYNTIGRYGPWFQTLQPRDPVALLISRRMLKTDPWGGIGGVYFTRQWEAYMALLYNRTPAQWVYLEDLKPDTWKRFKAVIAVDQRIQPEADWTAALAGARAAGLAIFADGTCRPEFVPGATPLGVSFDGIEKIPAFNVDAAYWQFPERLLADARILSPVLSKVVPSVATLDQPEVLASERGAGQGRFLWVVNNTHDPLPAEMLYRVNEGISSQMPEVANVAIPNTAGKTVYEVFSQQEVVPDAHGTVRADLRTLDAALYAVLPHPIGRVALSAPGRLSAGEEFPWKVAVQTADGQPLDANLPVRIALMSGTTVLSQRLLSVPGAGASGSFTVPVNLGAAAPAVTIEATELVSGHAASQPIGVLPGKTVALLTSGVDNTPAAAGPAGAATQQLRHSPAAAAFGSRLRDMVVSPDGRTAYLSALQWGDNLYAMDLATGAVKWQKKIGQYWALGTHPFGEGVAVGGFDFNSAEGYQVYTVNAAGAAARRFAVYGLPNATPSIFTITFLANYPTLGFAASPGGDWVAASGDLGVAVWSPAGQKLWSLDLWKDGQRHDPLRIFAAGPGAVITVDGLQLTAYQPQTGAVLWERKLAVVDGQVQQLRVSPDGATIAVLSTVDGGRVFIIRQGALVDAVPVKGTEFDFSSDGQMLAVVDGNQLKVLQANGGLVWSYSSDSPLHFPHFSPDGSHLAVSSELGLLTIADRAGADRHEIDLHSVASLSWLPDGDLIASTWLGNVRRFSAAKAFATAWSSRPMPGHTDNLAAHLLDADATPAVRMANWSNAEPAGAAAPASIAGRTDVSIVRDERGVNIGDPNRLVDGKLEAPANAYLTPGALTPSRTAIVLDRGKNLIKVDSITFYEDEHHPETWLRDVDLESWDSVARRWLTIQRLLSDQANHTHKLKQPVEASRLRVLLPPYPNSDIRLKEISLGGQDLGPAWPPDVRDKKAVAVLFDDNLGDLQPYQNGFDLGYQPKNQADAYSGASYFVFDPATNGGLNVMRPYNDIDGWMHPIAENPQPGQYRWLQMAVKRLSPKLTQIKLWPGHPDTHPSIVVPLKPTDEWQLIRIDLWALLKQPINLTQMFIGFENGAGAVDQIVLGRTQADLDAVKPIVKQ